MIGEGDCGAIGGMKIGRGNRCTRRKPAPAPLCPPQIYRVYHNSTAKLQKRTPHVERRKKVYDNLGPEMHMITE
jgi:hypothetical protein